MPFLSKRWLVVAVMAFAGNPAFAAPPPTPFGLDQLQIGMSQTDAIRVLRRWPSLSPPPRGDNSFISEGAAHAGPYAWRDCVFDISLFFLAPRKEAAYALNSIVLQSAHSPSARCQSEIGEELTAHYGAGTPDTKLVPAGEGEAQSWKLPDILVRYAHKTHEPPFGLFYSTLAIDPKTVGTMVQISDTGPAAMTIYDVMDRVPPPPNLSYALAMAGAQAALQACHRAKIPGVVEVFGQEGELRVLLQDDDIRSYEAPEHARDKAYAVFLTDRPSRDYDKSLQTGDRGKLDKGGMERKPMFPPGKPFIAADPMAKPGALPVVIGNYFVGVVSVDGGWDYAGGHDDEAWDGDEGCARAGVAAIQRQWPK